MKFGGRGREKGGLGGGKWGISWKRSIARRGKKEGSLLG